MGVTMHVEAERAKELAGRLFEAALGAFDGPQHPSRAARLGFFAALAERGPLTSPELEAVTGVAERHAREWLEQQADVSSPRASPSTDANWTSNRARPSPRRGQAPARPRLRPTGDAGARAQLRRATPRSRPARFALASNAFAGQRRRVMRWGTSRSSHRRSSPLAGPSCMRLGGATRRVQRRSTKRPRSRGGRVTGASRPAPSESSHTSTSCGAATSAPDRSSRPRTR